MADVTKGIRGYVTDTRRIRGNTRMSLRPIYQIYASLRPINRFTAYAGLYQSSHGYAQIRGLDIRQYADIRGHSHRFAEVGYGRANEGGVGVFMWCVVVTTIHIKIVQTI